MPENNKWKFRMTEWRGYVIRALEDIDGKLKELGNGQEELRDHVNEELTVMRGRIKKIELAQSTSKVEWGIYKKVLLFLGGAVAMGAITLIFKYITMTLLGA